MLLSSDSISFLDDVSKAMAAAKSGGRGVHQGFSFDIPLLSFRFFEENFLALKRKGSKNQG